MPSRQEQLQSYQFMVQRVVSALVLRETDPPQSPFRRAVGAAFASVLVTVIIAAGFGVYGIFTGGGNQKWKVNNAVIIEKKSAAVFLYRDDKLLPALNLASAILASDSPKPPRFEVSAKSLQTVPWGQTIGIPNLPSSMAEKKDLAGYPWSVCAVAKDETMASAVVIGDVAGRTVGEGEAFVVRAATRGNAVYDTFVLWNGRKFEISRAAAEKLAPAVNPIPVPLAFLNGMSQGDTLEPLSIPGAGKQSQLNPAWKVGVVLTITGAAAEDQHVVVREEDLAWITQVQAQMLPFHGRDSLNEATQGGRIKVGDLRPKDSGLQTPPAKLPDFNNNVGSGLCSVLKDADGRAELRADSAVDIGSRPQTAKRSSSNAAYADYVLVPDGKGAIIQSGQTQSYVSRDGVRYAAANLGVLSKFGYEGVTPLQLPSNLVALLPEGPGLDPAAALTPVTVA